MYYPGYGDISSYTKFGTIVASNASVIQMRKALISPQVEMRAFCLLRRCPKPRRTLVRVLEMLENPSGYAILQIAKWASTPLKTTEGIPQRLQYRKWIEAESIFSAD